MRTMELATRLGIMYLSKICKDSEVNVESKEEAEDLQQRIME